MSEITELAKKERAQYLLGYQAGRAAALKEVIEWCEQNKIGPEGYGYCIEIESLKVKFGEDEK